MADMMQLPDLSSCSPSTQEAGFVVQDKIYDGMASGIDLANELHFLENVATWIEENAPMFPPPTIYEFNSEDDA